MYAIIKHQYMCVSFVATFSKALMFSLPTIANYMDTKSRTIYYCMAVIPVNKLGMKGMLRCWRVACFWMLQHVIIHVHM